MKTSHIALAVAAAAALALPAVASATTGSQTEYHETATITDKGVQWSPSIKTRVKLNTGVTVRFDVVNKASRSHWFQVGTKRTKKLFKGQKTRFFYAFNKLGAVYWKDGARPRERLEVPRPLQHQLPESLPLMRRAGWPAIPFALATGIACAAAPAHAAWTAPNGTAASTRASADPAMSASAARRLRRIWRFEIPELTTAEGLIASTPLIAGGMVYLETLNSNVYALDARTGHVRWRRRFDRESGGPNGLVLRGTRLYGTTPRSVFALSRMTGRVLWTRRVAGSGTQLDIAPALDGGLVLVGTTAQTPGTKGALVALRSSDGRPAWRLSTIAGTWADPKVASGGSVWLTPSVDAAGGIWAGTGNPLPWGGTPALPDGAAYAGSARYTDSLLHVTARGRLAWFDQVTAHDVRDYDFALPPMLTRADGRAVAIGAGKAGLVIAWDRVTGSRLWSAPVGVHRNDRGPLPTKAVTVCPGLYGGVLTPMATARGRVFAPVVDLCMRGSATGYEPLDGVDVDARGRGELDALDAATGRALWTRRFSSPALGCATAAGAAVFTATYSGRVYALSQRTGRAFWSVQEPAGVSGCPAVSGRLVLVPAGAEPQAIRTATPVLDAYLAP